MTRPSPESDLHEELSERSVGHSRRTYINRLVLRSPGGLVAVLLQVSNRLDQPANRPYDDPEDVARCPERWRAAAGDVRRVEDDHWQRDDPDPDDLACNDGP